MVCLTPVALAVPQMITPSHQLDKPERPMIYETSVEKNISLAGSFSSILE
jgi:hypothetical protein